MDNWGELSWRFVFEPWDLDQMNRETSTLVELSYYENSLSV